MPSPPLLDFDPLLAPIPGDQPAGEGVPFTTREKLEEVRKEVNPEDFAADDPMRPSEPKRADWVAIERLTKQVLMENCKDLLTAARLTESLVRRNGFAGLRDGLHLLRRLIDDCWDRILPSIEDGDLEMSPAPSTGWTSRTAALASRTPSARSPWCRAATGLSAGSTGARRWTARAASPTRCSTKHCKPPRRTAWADRRGPGRGVPGTALPGSQPRSQAWT